MVSFELFVKAMPPSLSELKVLPSFGFAFKIPDDVAASNIEDNHYITSATFGLFSDPPTHYVSINTVLNVSK